VNDCKQLTDGQLKKIYQQLIGSVEYYYEIVTASECDKELLKSEYNHIKKMCSKIKPDVVLIDYHSIPDKFHYIQCGVEKGDQVCWSIAAASVIAKYIHDEYMRDLALKYPEYNLASNRGSIGQQLFNLTLEHGLTPEHRRQWVYSMAKKRNINPIMFRSHKCTPATDI
jgi:ribonuclease HII